MFFLWIMKQRHNLLLKIINLTLEVFLKSHDVNEFKSWIRQTVRAEIIHNLILDNKKCSHMKPLTAD